MKKSDDLLNKYSSYRFANHFETFIFASSCYIIIAFIILGTIALQTINNIILGIFALYISTIIGILIGIKLLLIFIKKHSF